jgi:poly-gamma-glutamate capsule biosynthesis protein CapA/YwtB (metallophosphatase superfamily)
MLGSMGITIALGGDTMLGRGVGDRISARGPYGLFSGEVRETFAKADLRVLNLECCVSRRGQEWNAEGRPFHFRAPPEAVGVLTDLNIDCVTLANNHAMDYGEVSLRDTLRHLSKAGIRTVGAGRDQAEARSPVVMRAKDTSVAVIAVTDHPADYAAEEKSPGVAYAPLTEGVPLWLTETIRKAARKHDVVLVTPHWGPNMTTEPLDHVRKAADAFLEAGATLVAGHSAHVFHGVNGPILYDLGDLIDDYARDRTLRNDLGLLWLATIDGKNVRINALPLHLEYAKTEVATGTERSWIKNRLTAACREYATEVTERDGLISAIPSATAP